jgi:hypothetical protein
MFLVRPRLPLIAASAKTGSESSAARAFSGSAGLQAFDITGAISGRRGLHLWHLGHTISSLDRFRNGRVTGREAKIRTPDVIRISPMRTAVVNG